MGDNSTDSGTSIAFTLQRLSRALKKIKLFCSKQSFGEDKAILGVTSGGSFIDKDSGNSVFYHQNEDTGFRSFQAGETVNETDGTGQGVLDGGAFETAFEVNPHR